MRNLSPTEPSREIVRRLQEEVKLDLTEPERLCLWAYQDVIRRAIPYTWARQPLDGWAYELVYSDDGSLPEVLLAGELMRVRIGFSYLLPELLGFRTWTLARDYRGLGLDTFTVVGTAPLDPETEIQVKWQPQNRRERTAY